LKEFTTDFLNLIFGNDDSTSHFWNILLTNQIEYDFEYHIDQDIRKQIPLGGLLFAILHNCNINLQFTEDIKLG